jgi:hypothetical protein
MSEPQSAKPLFRIVPLVKLQSVSTAVRMSRSGASRPVKPIRRDYGWVDGKPSGLRGK